MNEQSKVQPVDEVVAIKKPKRARKAKRWGILLAVPLLIAAVGLYFYVSSGKTVSTDNAAVKQDIVSVSAQAVGPVSEVLVVNGQAVRRGQVLFRIDPAPFQVALEQAEAQLSSARLQSSQLQTQSAGTGADITGAGANLQIKRNALGRQSALLKRGFTTRSDYEDALNEVRTAEAALADARARSANAAAAIAPGEQPLVAQAQAAVDKARLDLSHTSVRAPFDGIIANADRLQLGQAVAPGVGVLSLVHGKNAWIEANFKEKDLDRMRAGQAADIKIDAYPDQHFKGHVATIGAGTGGQFAIIPAQNANGNWVKVTQRVPVRIAIDGTPSRTMIAGLSANVTVDLDPSR